MVAVSGVFFHRFLGDLAQAFRYVGSNLRERFRLFGNLHDRNRDRAAAIERQMAGEHLIQHNADRINIGARIGMVALGLFRADIMHRTDCLVTDCLALRAGKTRDAKVHHLDRTVSL